MGKIYDDGKKLNNVEVINALIAGLSENCKDIIASNIPTEVVSDNPRQTMVYAMIESYKDLPAQTEEDMKMKKYVLFLIDKYMKSKIMMDGENEAYQMLLTKITITN